MTTAFADGTPCWYELGTTDLTAAAHFYGQVFGWTVADSGMPDVAYHLATAADGGTVAGMMDLTHMDGAPPPNWLIYFTAASCDAKAAAVAAAGGAIHVPPTDIPGTGRFAVCADPQGAVFGLLQPSPMDDAPPQPAFDQAAVGHGNWHELLTTDPAAAVDFYAAQFGWTRGEAMDMGDMGTYQLFRHDGTDIGGMMGLGDAPLPTWMPYFGTASVEDAIASITAAGGSVHHGPAEVPGGAYIAVAQDPQGAWFAVVGPRST